MINMEVCESQLQQNYKDESEGGKCHVRTMVHDEADKSFKMNVITDQGRTRFQGNVTTLDESCFTTGERNFWKIARYIVPNFIND